VPSAVPAHDGRRIDRLHVLVRVRGRWAVRHARAPIGRVLDGKTECMTGTLFGGLSVESVLCKRWLKLRRSHAF